MVDGEVVEHEPGPFDGIRLTFTVLRQPTRRHAKFVEIVRQMATKLPVRVQDAVRGEDVPIAELILRLRADCETVSAHWLRRGIRCGSEAALAVNY